MVSERNEMVILHMSERSMVRAMGEEQLKDENFWDREIHSV